VLKGVGKIGKVSEEEKEFTCVYSKSTKEIVGLPELSLFYLEDFAAQANTFIWELH
jgi:hypothetical protein